MNYTMKLSKKLSFGEEIANSVTHAVGALLMLILLPISAVYSFEQHGLLSAFGTSIFVISLFLMFLSSTVYHPCLTIHLKSMCFVLSIIP